MRTAALLLAFLLSAGCGARLTVPSATPEKFAQIDLAARVKTALLNDKIIGERRIDVAAINGDVTLTGRVASTGERDRAVAVARAVQGVRSVQERFEIRP